MYIYIYIYIFFFLTDIFETGYFLLFQGMIVRGSFSVPKFMFDSVDPQTKEGSSVFLCNHQIFESLHDRGDGPANTILQFRFHKTLLMEEEEKLFSLPHRQTKYKCINLSIKQNSYSTKQK